MLRLNQHTDALLQAIHHTPFRHQTPFRRVTHRHQANIMPQSRRQRRISCALIDAGDVDVDGALSSPTPDNLDVVGRAPERSPLKGRP